MSLTNTKSLLAKLLASENLTVEHGNFPTASMDVKNRILRLPIWKEMSGSLYDLMVLHEVGHALYTPEEGWHKSVSNKGKGYKSFLNVVEDARIERKIKDKYPGGRRSFTEGYLDLIKKDFFGLRDTELEDLNLIDRINLHFKGGTLHDINFTDEENEFVEKVRTTVTWADVVRVTDELYEYAKEHDSETDMSDHSDWEYELSEEDDENDDMSGDSEGFSDEEENEDGTSDSTTDEGEKGESEGEEKSGSEDSNKEGKKTDNSLGSGSGVGSPSNEDYIPHSETDENFRSRESELVTEDTGASITYINLPVANLDDLIIDHKEIHKVISDHYSASGEEYVRGGGTHDRTEEITEAGKDFVDFRNKNKKTVEYLAKEFEMKKAADAHSRTATANSGIIDTGMLHTYKYNEHIFKKINVTADGKNHGLVMVVDWSGSMNRNIKGTIEQMMVLVMFAKRVNIPFEVFLFSDSYGSEFMNGNARGVNDSWTHKDGGKHGDLIIDQHHLLNVFSSRMRANELHTAYINMTALAGAYDYSYSNYYGRDSRYRTIPSKLNLGGTPLNASLLAMNNFIPEFKSKNGVQIVNLIYLTDGDSAGGNSVWNRLGEGNTSERIGSRRESGVFLRDIVTKKEYELSESYHLGFSRGSMTNSLVEVLRDKHKCNVVNFYIVDRFKNYDAAEFATTEIPPQVILSKFRKEGHIIAKNYGGWSEMYLIKGGKNLDVEEAIFETKEDAKKGEIKRAFAKFNKGKLKNRVLLSKFVDMVAA
jgi:Mg-chelatase subunit ChlD